MLLGELLKSLLGKAGVKTDDEGLKKLLSNAEAMQIDVPDDLARPLETNLLTVESAKANSDVRSPIWAEALNGLDSELNNTVTALPFEDAFKNDVRGITKNTHDKLRKVTSGINSMIGSLNQQLKDAKSKPKDANSEAEIKSLNDQIQQLNTQITNLKALHTGEVENLRSANLADRKNFVTRSKLAGKPLPKNGIPQEINILTAETLVRQEMAKHGLTLNFDEFGNPILKQKKDGAEIDFFVDNKRVDFDGFLDGVLSQNKFVQINDQNSGNGGGGNGNAGKSGGGNNGNQNQGGAPVNLHLANETAELIKQLDASMV